MKLISISGFFHNELSTGLGLTLPVENAEAEQAWERTTKHWDAHYMKCRKQGTKKAMVKDLIDQLWEIAAEIKKEVILVENANPPLLYGTGKSRIDLGKMLSPSFGQSKFARTNENEVRVVTALNNIRLLEKYGHLKIDNWNGMLYQYV